MLVTTVDVSATICRKCKWYLTFYSATPIFFKEMAASVSGNGERVPGDKII